MDFDQLKINCPSRMLVPHENELKYYCQARIVGFRTINDSPHLVYDQCLEKYCNRFYWAKKIANHHP